MTEFLMNRKANALNPYQGSHKRVLCVCSAGLLRSPTAALVLSQDPYNFNTRAAGLSREFALVPVDEVLLHWADEVICMDELQATQIRNMLPDGKPVISLNIEDSFEYRNPRLVERIKQAYDKATNETHA